MKKQNWSSVIKKLQAKGFTQKQIEDATGIDQPAVSRMLAGQYEDVLWHRGNALLELLAK